MIDPILKDSAMGYLKTLVDLMDEKGSPLSFDPQVKMTESEKSHLLSILHYLSDEEALDVRYSNETGLPVLAFRTHLSDILLQYHFEDSPNNLYTSYHAPLPSKPVD